MWSPVPMLCSLQGFSHPLIHRELQPWFPSQEAVWGSLSEKALPDTDTFDKPKQCTSHLDSLHISHILKPSCCHCSVVMESIISLLSVALMYLLFSSSGLTLTL
jgi:hypothetical protein